MTAAGAIVSLDYEITISSQAERDSSNSIGYTHLRNMDENSSRPKAADSRPESDSTVPLSPGRDLPSRFTQRGRVAQGYRGAEAAKEHGRRRVQQICKVEYLRANASSLTDRYEAGWTVNAVLPSCSGLV